MPLLITTSRRPSRRTRTFAKELNMVLPGSIRLNRGKASLYEIKNTMIKKGLNKLLIIDTRKGNPSRINFLTLSLEGFNKNMVIHIEGLILQMDKKQKIKLVDILDIEMKNIPDKYKKTLNYFFKLPPIYVGEGIKGYIDVRFDNEELIWSFLSHKGTRIYPLIRGRIIHHEPI